MTTDHEAKAREVVKKQFGLFGFDLVLAPKHEAAAIKVVASALREVEAGERERCLQALSGEIKSVTLGEEMIAKGITEQDAISLGNQFMIIARAAIRADGNGKFEESGATVDVNDLAASIRSRSETDE